MRRALRLAALGCGRVSPNPMVGAVVTARGRVIGEGWHRAYGGPHAEVNAIASVRGDDRLLLPEATVYVTLEPCSHYGKTPPCAKLLCDTGVKRVVTGCADPNPLVGGRGIRMLREAGIEVTEGVLEQECRNINRRFITAQTLKRPYVQLKYAVSADDFMAAEPGGERLMISDHLTSVWMHRERSKADAVFAGTATVVADNPRLDCRLWPGREPLRCTFTNPRLPVDSHVMQGRHVLVAEGEPLADFASRLFAEEGVSSLMVEGGAATLRSFIDAGLYDEIRIETSPIAAGKGLRAPDVPPDVVLKESFTSRGHRIDTYIKGHGQNTLEKNLNKT